MLIMQAYSISSLHVFREHLADDLPLPSWQVLCLFFDVAFVVQRVLWLIGRLWAWRHSWYVSQSLTTNLHLLLLHRSRYRRVASLVVPLCLALAHGIPEDLMEWCHQLWCRRHQVGLLLAVWHEVVFTECLVEVIFDLLELFRPWFWLGFGLRFLRLTCLGLALWLLALNCLLSDWFSIDWFKLVFGQASDRLLPQDRSMSQILSHIVPLGQ